MGHLLNVQGLPLLAQVNYLAAVLWLALSNYRMGGGIWLTWAVCHTQGQFHYRQTTRQCELIGNLPRRTGGLSDELQCQKGSVGI
jgi:hypothetical protein